MGVAERVVFHAMTARSCFRHELWTGYCPLAYAEEGGLDSILIEHLQYFGRDGRVWTIVEAQGNLPASRSRWG
jgi:hypothetical protein